MPGDLEFTLPSAHGQAVYPAAATFGPRTMRDFEFVWIMEGNAEYRRSDITGDTTVECPQGSIVLCRPNATDFFRWDQRRRTRHAYFHFDVSRTPGHWPPMDEWPLVRVDQHPIDGPSQDILASMFRYLLTWIGRGSDDLCRLTVAHMLSSFVLGEVTTRPFSPDACPEPVERAQQLIAQTLEKDPAAVIGLDDLADAALVTPSHLCRLFKSSTGRSPVETVRLARLDRAVALVARSNYSLKQIAEICGYSSAFHLSRAIKQSLGQSPKAIRQRIKAGHLPPLPRLHPADWT